MSDAPVEVGSLSIGGREFLQVGDVVIPVDSITSFDLNAPNGGCDNSVRIHTDPPDWDLIWAYDNADAIRAFLRKSGTLSSSMGEDMDE